MVRFRCRAVVSQLLPACLWAIAWVPSAFADEPARDGGLIEEIVVTGSHRALPAQDTPVPVVVIRQEDIAASGANSIADLARFLTVNAGVRNDAALELTAIAGTSYFNLRGVGAQNTLVLVNGKRVSPYGASQTNGQTIVDINAIPIGAIDRIEILKDGASAVYGSDAIGGVVNILLRHRADGPSLGVGYLTSSRGDHDETTVEATWGLRTDQAEIVATASYLGRGRLRSVDREFLADADLRPVGGFNQRSTFSSPMSALRLAVGELHADPACPDDPTNPLVYFEAFPRPNPRLISMCRYNYKLFTDAVPASERLGISAAARYELGARTALTTDLIASRTTTRIRLAPDPTENTPLTTPFPMVAADHPSNPFGEALATNYRVADAGARKRQARANAGRIVVGLVHEGNIWDLQLSALAARSSSALTDFNVIDAVSFQEALLGRGGDDGAAYYNPFGLDPANAADVISGFTIGATQREEVFRERSIDLSVERPLGELGGGAAHVVFGAQFRDQHLYGSADAFQRNGLALALDLLRPFDAARQVRAAYAEFALPLLDTMTIQLAARHERYSDFGSATNPKLAILWRATGRLALRASWGTSFRAPAFGELYRKPLESLSIVRDNVRCELIGTPLECSRYPYRTYSGGNPDLEPEDGRSLYFGISVGDRTSGGTSLDLAWWQLDHENRIIEPGASFIIDRFGEDPEFVLRSPPAPNDPPGVPGPIASINSRAFNLETLQTRGVDFDLRFAPVDARYDLRIGATYLDRFRVSDPATGGSPLELAGRAVLYPLPRLRGNVTMRWRTRRSDWTLAAHFTDAYWSPRNLVVDGQETENIPYRIDSHLTFDLQYARPFGENESVWLRAGCRNCLDAAPPDYNYTTIGEYLHDPRGALVYVRLESRLQ